MAEKYKDAGVDIDKANLFVEKIKPLIKTTTRKGVVGGIGSFGGLFHLDMEKYRNPLLVSTTDGVGTKLNIAHTMDIHDTVGVDLVAMSVNDLIVQGAEPLFFLDYIATGKISIENSVKIVEGIVRGCVEAECALIGGETAEMPGFYKDNEYDLAGFCVGIVEYDKLIDGSEISVGDKILGLASNGIHSNGLSLARDVLFNRAKLTVHDTIEGLPDSLGIELLRPTKIYVSSIMKLIKHFSIKGIVNITGGGFIDNIPRIIPDRCKAVIKRGTWEVNDIFKIIQKTGQIDDMEMFRVFNMGIGMMLIISEEDTKEILDRLEYLGEKAYEIGVISDRKNDANQVTFG
jgi:phosphoribosylformylglycinamidine cyclo-ligase